MSDDKLPNPVDVYVGGRVRLRRKFLRISQETLSSQLNLTFQQVQKYERGMNRISASKLYQISRALQTPITYFFDGFEHEAGDGFSEPASEIRVHAFLTTAEGMDLAESFPRIKSARLRRKVLELVRSLADD
ncbi:helix-turn-helix domain-containing protein [Neorhizobium galegae]|uniref:helix-turn-helix domain-containing protein n=1 Tax=Neorhizobium galegae TaxID=399 RepID=UPI000621546E|nr:helix-turn-helix transcriptional regulator [Neorhizobium galegae]MCQ1805817.1 helix-turn-helix domain-containing protein [Neorhizobium galegae]CDZ59626.1 Transcriptional regulator, Cro/CI family [Neorhizobium galegae bv. orientalis]